MFCFVTIALCSFCSRSKSVFRSLWQTMLTRQTSKNAQLAVKLRHILSGDLWKEFRAAQTMLHLSVFGSVQFQFTEMINWNWNSYNSYAAFTLSNLYMGGIWDTLEKNPTWLHESLQKDKNFKLTVSSLHRFNPDVSVLFYLNCI